jgi:hypothetical protein
MIKMKIETKELEKLSKGEILVTNDPLYDKENGEYRLPKWVMDSMARGLAPGILTSFLIEKEERKNGGYISIDDFCSRIWRKRVEQAKTNSDGA